jgi:hypothetical protein
MSSYIDLEGLIVARLEQRVTALPAGRVLTLPDMAAVDERAQITPALHLIFAGEHVAEPPRGAIQQLATQQWVVIVAVRSAEEILTGAAARAAAGPLVAAVNEALIGWTPGPEYDPMVRTGGLRTTYRHGFLYYPQAFACTFPIRGVR